MLLALRPDGSVYLTRRPPAGIWGGLWCAPAFDSSGEARGFAQGVLGEAAALESLQPLEHAFTHFDLTIRPLLLRCGEAGGPDRVAHAGADARLPSGTARLVADGNDTAAQVAPGSVMDVGAALWYNARRPANVGLPAPVKTLIERVAAE